MKKLWKSYDPIEDGYKMKTCDLESMIETGDKMMEDVKRFNALNLEKLSELYDRVEEVEIVCNIDGKLDKACSNAHSLIENHLGVPISQKKLQRALKIRSDTVMFRVLKKLEESGQYKFKKVGRHIIIDWI